MLLHRLGTIQSIHESSIDQVEISNTSVTSPSSSRGWTRTGYARLGGAWPDTRGDYGSAGVRPAGVPVPVSPHPSEGSIHRYGDRHRLQSILYNYPNPTTGRRTNHLWEVQTEDSVDGNIREAVEELAYRIYLDLLRERAFKSCIDRHSL